MKSALEKRGFYILGAHEIELIWREAASGRASTTSCAPQGYSEEGWIDSLDLAKVEISSEEPSFPIEHALTGCAEGGWVASEQQTIRLTFESPQKLSRIRLLFREEARAGLRDSC